MRLSKFTTHRPGTVKEAVSLLKKHKDKAALKAGGTALVPEIKLGLLKPEHVILLEAIEGLDSIEEKEDGLHIGAMASLQAIEQSAVVKKGYPALAEAAEVVSAPSLHCQSTIGGNICQNTRCMYYDQSAFWRGVKGPCFKQGGDRCNAAPGMKNCHSVYQGDLAPVLICMDTKVRVVSPKKEEVMNLSDLFTGKGANPFRLDGSRLLTEVILPKLDAKKVAYEKLTERAALDYPLAGVAAFIKMHGENIEESGFVVTAMGPAPIVVSEPFLRSRRFDDAFISEAADMVSKKTKPLANLSTTPAYRKQMTKVLVERVLRRLKA